MKKKKMKKKTFRRLNVYKVERMLVDKIYESNPDGKYVRDNGNIRNLVVKAIVFPQNPFKFFNYSCQNIN